MFRELKVVYSYVKKWSSYFRNWADFSEIEITVIVAGLFVISQVMKSLSVNNWLLKDSILATRNPLLIFLGVNIEGKVCETSSVIS